MNVDKCRLRITNDDVKISVIEVKGKNIRLGIDAPKTTKVYREEVFLKIQEENKIASSTPAGFDPGNAHC